MSLQRGRKKFRGKRSTHKVAGAVLVQRRKQQLKKTSYRSSTRLHVKKTHRKVAKGDISVKERIGNTIFKKTESFIQL
jgi:hypothetical protein